jgi:hypothetical protein
MTGLKKINSYGEVADFQPSLLDQARARASSMHKRTGSNVSLSKRIPRGRGHSRHGSNASASSFNLSTAAVVEVGGSLTEPTDAGGLTQEDIDQSYSKADRGFRSIWSTR